MKNNSWSLFRAKHPELAQEVLRLGVSLYEKGATEAKSATELCELMSVLTDAPREAREALGLEKHPVTESDLLTVIFQTGSTLLLDYVRNGTCEKPR